MKKTYKILLTSSLLVNFGSNLIGPFYAVFVKNIGGTILDMGLTVTVFSIFTGILMIIIGAFSDKLNKEIITIFGYGFFALGSLFYLVITEPWQLFVLQLIFAAGSACLAAPLNALFAKYIQKGKEGLQWSLESGGDRIAVGIAVFLGTMIVNYLGFKFLFLAMFTIQVVAIVVQLQIFFVKEKD